MSFIGDASRLFSVQYVLEILNQDNIVIMGEIEFIYHAKISSKFLQLSGNSFRLIKNMLH